MSGLLDIILSEFHFSTLWNGGILIYIGFIFIIYFLLLPQDKKYPIWRQVAFVLGMVAVFAALGSPINVIGRIQYSMHIVQLVLLLLIAPPLLIIGFKTEIITRAKEISWLDKLLSFLSKPVVGFLSFFILFYIYHLDVVFTWARQDLYINYFFMLGLLFAAILLWIPILSSNKLAESKKVGFTLLSCFGFIPYAVLLLVQHESMYLVYTDPGMFLQSLEACIPNIDDIPLEFAKALLPFNPVEEQVRGGGFLLTSVLLIFGAALFLGRKRSIQKEGTAS